MFEFLDEREPATLVIPPAPIVVATPVVAPTPTVERREPSGYTAPVFFPFGKPEPTAPQLKLSGVSSFKKINRSDERIRNLAHCFLLTVRTAHFLRWVAMSRGKAPTSRNSYGLLSAFPRRRK